MNIIQKFLQRLAQQTAGKAPIAKHLAHIALYELKGKNALYPDVKEKYIKLQEIMALRGMPIYLSEGFRTAKKQDTYYAKGRTTKGNVITNAKGLQSYHQYGLAFDVIFVGYKWNPPGDIWWWILGNEGKALGLEWGGDWKSKDYPHFQFTANGTIHWKNLKPYLER